MLSFVAYLKRRNRDIIALPENIMMAIFTLKISVRMTGNERSFCMPTPSLLSKMISVIVRKMSMIKINVIHASILNKIPLFVSAFL